MKKLFIIICLIVICFIPCKIARVFASTEKILNIYDFAYINDSYIVLLDNYQYNNDIIDALLLTKDSSINLSKILNIDLRQPTLVSCQKNFYSIFDYDTKKIYLANYNNEFLYSCNEYTSSLGLTKNINLIDIFGYDSSIFAINCSNSKNKTTYSLLKLSENEKRFVTLLDFENYSLDNTSKIFVCLDNIYVSSLDGIIEIELSTLSSNILKSNENYDYFFLDCKNNFHYLKEHLLDDSKNINYSNLIDFDRESGNLYTLSNSFIVTSSDFDLFSKIIKNEKIVDGVSNFVDPNSIENFTLNNLDQIKYVKNQGIYDSPYSLKESNNINQNVIVIGKISENLSEEYSFVVYNFQNKLKSGYIKSSKLTNPIIQQENQTYIALKNFTFISKYFGNINNVGYIKKEELISPICSIIENNVEYFIINYSNALGICTKSNFAPNKTNIKPIFVANAYLSSNSSIIMISKNKEILNLKEQTEIQLNSTDNNYAYFYINIDGEIINCKTEKINLVKNDNLHLATIIIFILVILSLSIFLLIFIKKSKIRNLYR